MSDLTPIPPAQTHRAALLMGASLIEIELRRLRQHAMSLDGNPYGQQHHITPVAENERIFLETLDLASKMTILREMARNENGT